MREREWEREGAITTSNMKYCIVNLDVCVFFPQLHTHWHQEEEDADVPESARVGKLTMRRRVPVLCTVRQ